MFFLFLSAFGAVDKGGSRASSFLFADKKIDLCRGGRGGSGGDGGGAGKYSNMRWEGVGGGGRVSRKIRTRLRSGPWRSGRHTDRNSGDISDVKM